MTAVKDLQTLYDYCYWANGKLLDVVVKLTPEQFTEPVAGSYGSVRNTLVHILIRQKNSWVDSGSGSLPSE